MNVQGQNKLAATKKIERIDDAMKKTKLTLVSHLHTMDENRLEKAVFNLFFHKENKTKWTRRQLMIWNGSIWKGGKNRVAFEQFQE